MPRKFVSGNITATIVSVVKPGREYSRADLLTATDIKETEWIWAIRQLKELGKVMQFGEKRGTRYVLNTNQDTAIDC